MPRPDLINRAFTLVIMGIVLGLATAWGQCATAGSPSLNPIDLYRRSLDAGQTVSYTGRQFIVSFGDDSRSSSFVTQITHKAPDAYSIVYRAPRSYAGQTIIQTKTQQWTYMPRTNTIVHTNVPERTMTRAVKLRVLSENYKITRVLEPKILAGRKTFEVIVQRRGNPTASARYWIDPYTGLTLRTERNHVDGSLAFVSYFSELKVNPPISAKAFDPGSLRRPGTGNIEKSATVESSDLTTAQLARAIGGFAIAPAKLDTFEFQGASIMANKGHETLHIRYSDGLSSLSLFESARRTTKSTVVPHSWPVTLGRFGAGRADREMHYNAVNWDRGRLNLTLVGDMAVPELCKLIEGM